MFPVYNYRRLETNMYFVNLQFNDNVITGLFSEFFSFESRFLYEKNC